MMMMKRMMMHAHRNWRKSDFQPNLSLILKQSSGPSLSCQIYVLQHKHEVYHTWLHYSNNTREVTICSIQKRSGSISGCNTYISECRYVEQVYNRGMRESRVAQIYVCVNVEQLYNRHIWVNVEQLGYNISMSECRHRAETIEGYGWI